MTQATPSLSPAAPRSHAGVGLLEQLRDETADQHRELETTVDITRRVSDRDAYTHLLEKFYGFYQPLEMKLAASFAAGRDGLRLAERCQKGRWLAEDLAQLGVRDVSQLPQCAALPELETWSRALGTMYVLEGSTLGGRHISGMLKMSPIPPQAQRFFSSYGAEVGGMWRSFCAILHEVAAPDEQEVAVANARATFASMQAWLVENR
jgi:heme oxygenase